MKQNKPQQPDVRNEKTESHNVTGMGAILRNERNKKILSYDQISEITRLRPHILEALENEDWARLPSPVIVRGFIRSYARTLGLEEGEIVALYKKAVPADTTVPRPLVEPVRRKRVFFVFVMFLLFALASAYYMWKEYPARERFLISPQETSPVDEKIAEPEDAPMVPSVISPIPLNPKNETDLAPKTDADIIDTIGTETPGDLPEEEIQPSVKKEIPPEAGIGIEVETPELILKANIIERTWIKVSVDGQSAKEYIFQPGSHPDWKAKDGFELMIGNAGGVEFELNGEKIKDLGESGKVVRIRLPEDYERRISQD